MSTKHIEALKLALEGAANYIDALGGDSRKYRQALAEQPAIKQDLTPEQSAQPQQEPVLVVEVEPDYMSGGHHHKGSKPYISLKKLWSIPIGTKLYTSPPAQRTWVGLTEEDIKEAEWLLSAIKEHEAYTLQEQLIVEGVDVFARAIEAKLKEKNGITKEQT